MHRIPEPFLPVLPSEWSGRLEKVCRTQRFLDLDGFLREEAGSRVSVLPTAEHVFAAFQLTSYDSVKVLLIGQDPYHTPGIAHGLCFSVQPHIRTLPPSLKNIFLELRSDLGCRVPNNGCLEAWARQGVLMLNAALTVRAHSPNSHRKPWQFFTDAVIELVNAKTTRVVFLLWGAEAQKKRHLVTNPEHVVICCAHPSPLSSRKFFGSRCFSRVNQSLCEVGEEPIDWQIPDI